MALVVPDVGEVELLTRMLDSDVVMHLYTNDVDPAESNTVSTFTEAGDASYSEATLTGGSWTIETESGVTSATYAQQDFVFEGAATVYGYYVTDVAGTTLLWAERFSSSASFGSGGGTISITPTIELA